MEGIATAAAAAGGAARRHGSAEVVSTAHDQGSASAQTRLQPGDAGFIQRLEIRVQNTQGGDLPSPFSPQEFTNLPNQETVTLDVIVPDPPFQILVSAFNNFNNQETKIFLSQQPTLIQSGQNSATIPLVRNPDPTTFILVPAAPASLQQTVFPFTDGAVFGFGLGGAPATLAVGSFQGNTGNFTLASGGLRPAAR